MTGLKRPLSLYLHFPFCVRKCRYCDFLSFSSDELTRENYLMRLEEELKFRSGDYRDYQVRTIFIGGGTPSLMTGEQLTRLMHTIYHYYDVSESAEMTMECNPGTVTYEKLSAYKAAGINRLSFGLQSMNDAELAYLGRIHTSEQFIANYNEARRAGFENINIDLMSALPGQTVDSWRDTLHKVMELEPEHISAYSLIIEEGTPFWDLYGDEETDDDASRGMNALSLTINNIEETSQMDRLKLPDEESERKMYHLTKKELSKKGYTRYETSNYAQDGRECKHNLTYWYRGDYLGVGLGAASMVNNQRFSNTRDMETYLRDFSYENQEVIDRQAQIEETMFLGLRCTRGIDLKKFRETFDVDVMTLYGDIIKRYEEQGFLSCLVTEDEERLCLTDKGMDVSNWILSDFLL